MMVAMNMQNKTDSKIMKEAIERLAAILLLMKRVYSLNDPPTIYCEENGGSITTRYVEDGVPMRICVFDDGTACDDACFFNGSCHKGTVPEYTAFCRANGGTLVSKMMDWAVENSPWTDYMNRWCIYDNGNACTDGTDDFYHSLCHNWNEWNDIVHSISIPFEMFCELSGGQNVNRGYVWGMDKDGHPLPATEMSDVCSFQVEDYRSILEKLTPKQAEILKGPGRWSGTHSQGEGDATGLLDQSIKEYAYYKTACNEESGSMFQTIGKPPSREEILVLVNENLSKYCSDIGGTSELRRDVNGDRYSLCVIGDRVCDLLQFYEERDECEKNAKIFFPVFCERSGGKLTNNQTLCTYEHKTSFPPLECDENTYYRGGCVVVATSFPFDETPTPSMPCDDGFYAEILQDGDGSEYAICVKTGPFEEHTGAWYEGSDKRVCSEWEMSSGGISCARDSPLFEEYCRNEHYGIRTPGKISFTERSLPVCTHTKWENSGGGYWVEDSGASVICTERFYYDNGGCLPFDVFGSDPPSGATVATILYTVLSVQAGLAMLYDQY